MEQPLACAALQRKVRDHRLELMRFIAAMLILVHHSYLVDAPLVDRPYYGGYIYVELFFYITGYFTLSHFYDLPREEIAGREGRLTLQYCFKKWCMLFPYAVVCEAAAILFGWLTSDSRTLGALAERCFFSLTELFFLRESGVSLNVNIPPLWYVSALMLVLPVFVYLILRHRGFFLAVVMILAPLFDYGYFYETDGNYLLLSPIASGYSRTPDLARAFAGLCVGALIYCIARRLRTLSLARWVRVVLTILEFAAIGGMILIPGVASTAGSNFFTLFLFVLLLLLLASRQTLTANWKLSWCGILGKISLPLYMCHWTIAQFVNLMWKPLLWQQKLGIVVAISLPVALLLYYVVGKLRLFQKLGGLLLARDSSVREAS